MSDIPESLFEKVYGRAATAADRRRLVAVRGALGLSDRDELWSILLVLDHYAQVSRYAESQVLQAIDGISDRVRSAGEAAGREMAEAMRREIEAALPGLMPAASKERLRQSRLRRGWLAAACLAAGLALGGGAAWLSVDRGFGTCAEPPQRLENGRMACYLR